MIRIICLILVIANSMVYAEEIPLEDQLGWIKDRKTSLAGITRIAIMPLKIRVDSPHAESAKLYLDDLIAQSLNELNIETISSDTYRDLLEKTKIEMDGYYDPYTGDIIEEKFNSIIELTQREYNRLYKFDATFTPAIIIHPVEFTGHSANWFGAEERTIRGTGRIGHPSSISGTLTAVSLFGVLSDGSDARLFTYGGGIQLRKKIGSKTLDFISTPGEELLADQAKLASAVVHMTEPLLKPMRTRTSLNRIAEEEKDSAREERRKKRKRK